MFPCRSVRSGLPRRGRARTAAVAISLVTAAVLALPSGRTAVAAAPTTPAVPAAPAAPVADPGYRPPVEGVIIDHFRAPPTPYAAGNRGLDYLTAPLTPVRATAAGEVIFAGPVAGALHVTVRHPDGLRSSYSFLAAVVVTAGQRVAGGAVLGWTGEVFHFGVRTPDGTYLDPEALFGRRREVHLVPGGDDGAPPASRADEGASLRGVVQDRLGPLAAALGHARGHGVAPADVLHRLRLLGHYAVELTPAVHELRVVRGIGAAVHAEQPCTPPDQAPPRPVGRRILVEVAGIGSTSEQAAVSRVDAAAFGYAPGDVVRFSYAGGRVPGAAPAPDLADLPVRPYDADDSQRDLADAARDLRRLLADIAARVPGVPVDVVAHSQGGVVARLALGDGAAGADPGGAGARSVRHVVTLGTPHRGAPAATAVDLVTGDPGGAAALDAGRRRLGLPLDPAAPSGRQLSEVSPVLADLAGSPLPPGVQLTSIGARGDLVVPAGSTATAGAGRDTVVALTGPHAHDDLPGSPAATREVALALAGAPPTCRSLASITADVVLADGIAWAEAAGAAAAGGVAAGTPP